MQKGLAKIARPLIRLGDPDRLPNAAGNQRMNNRRCCGTRRLGIGGESVGPPNNRSKNDGPEEKVLSLAKLTPAGRLPGGRA